MEFPNKNVDTLDKSLTYLFDTAHSIHHELYKNSSEPKYWKVCIDKFGIAYKKCGNEKGEEIFRKFFLKFYLKNPDFFEKPIFNVNKAEDQYLRSEEYQEGPGYKQFLETTQMKDSICINNTSYCKGCVIYASEKPELSIISIPVTEIYLCAVQLYKTGETTNKSFVFKVLLSLFSLMYHSVPEKNKEKIFENIKMINEKVLSILPNESQETTSGNGFNQIGDMISKFLKTSDGKQMSLENLISPKTVDMAKKALGEFVTNIEESNKEEGGFNMGALTKGLNKTLQSETVGSVLGEIGLPKNSLSNLSQTPSSGSRVPPSSLPVGYDEGAGDQD